MSNSELLPCPFCDSGVRRVLASGKLFYACGNADCFMHSVVVNEELWQTRAASPSEWQVPEGWKLVPIEATKEMVAAVYERRFCEVQTNGDVGCPPDKEYKEMLSAAPPNNHNREGA